MTGPGWIISTLLASQTRLSDTTLPSSLSQSSGDGAFITGLYRHAVKGLSADSLESVYIANAYDTFPDDRRFALLYNKNVNKFEESSPEWLHKENFLCAFTNPQLMAQYEASYSIIAGSGNNQQQQTYGLPCDDAKGSDDCDTTRRLLSLRDRRAANNHELLWGPHDLATHEGRLALGDFFSRRSGLPVQCVTAAAASNVSTKNDNNSQQQKQKHQFGNTSSGWKQRKDTRTIHLINANTVQQVAQKCNLPILNPTRFRPNIVVEGWDPWTEFDWIGKKLEIQSPCSSKTGQPPMRLSILSKTVRCDGVSIDPLDPDTILDIPKLLIDNFPEHGPYLGVYAVIEDPGTISLGDTVRLSSSLSSS